MFNCSNSLLWPNSKLCGTHGLFCDEANNTCVCSPGYTNLGDFSLFQDNACDINILSIQILWSWAISCGLLALILAVYSGCIAIDFSPGVNNYRRWSLPFFSFLQTFILLGIAIPRIIFPTDYIIGGNVYCTLLHGFFLHCSASHLFISFSGHIRAYQLYHLSRLGPDQKAKYMKQMAFVRFSLWILLLFIVFPNSYIPLILISRPYLVQLILGIHGLIVSFLFLFFGAFLAPRVMDYVLIMMLHTLKNLETNKIDSSTDKQEKILKKIIFKLKVLKTLCFLLFPPASLIMAIFSLWPYFSVKSSYCLPILYSMFCLGTAVSIWGSITSLKQPSLRRHTTLNQLFAWNSTPKKLPVQAIEI